MSATEQSPKRSRLEGSDNSENAASDERANVIARLLQQHQQKPNGIPERASGPAVQEGPTIGARPTFELPDFTGSSSLLARVQNFLPQLQQANANLGDHEGGSAFELEEQPSDDEDDEDSSKSEIRHKDMCVDKDESDEDDEDENAGPQIVMNLALGVFEEKKQKNENSSSDSDEDSDTSSDDDDSDNGSHVGTSHTNVRGTKIAGGSSSEQSGGRREADIAESRTAIDAKPKKPLIEELS